MASLARPKGLQNDPSNLVSVPGGQGGKAVQVAGPVAAPLALLRTKAAAAGFPAPLFEIVSGYRSSARQQQLFDAAVIKYGSQAAARKWVAPPGNSTHQTGYAVDFALGSSNSSSNVAALRATAAWQWLDANADALGWAPYTNEPWHWEYVGAGAVGGGGSAPGGAPGGRSWLGRAIGALVVLGGLVLGGRWLMRRM